MSEYKGLIKTQSILLSLMLIFSQQPVFAGLITNDGSSGGTPVAVADPFAKASSSSTTSASSIANNNFENANSSSPLSLPSSNTGFAGGIVRPPVTNPVILPVVNPPVLTGKAKVAAEVKSKLEEAFMTRPECAARTDCPVSITMAGTEGGAISIKMNDPYGRHAKGTVSRIDFNLRVSAGGTWTFSAPKITFFDTQSTNPNPTGSELPYYDSANYSAIMEYATGSLTTVLDTENRFDMKINKIADLQFVQILGSRQTGNLTEISFREIGTGYNSGTTVYTATVKRALYTGSAPLTAAEVIVTSNNKVNPPVTNPNPPVVIDKAKIAAGIKKQLEEAFMTGPQCAARTDCPVSLTMATTEGGAISIKYNDPYGRHAKGSVSRIDFNLTVNANGTWNFSAPKIAFFDTQSTTPNPTGSELPYYDSAKYSAIIEYASGSLTTVLDTENRFDMKVNKIADLQFVQILASRQTGNLTEISFREIGTGYNSGTAVYTATVNRSVTLSTPVSKSEVTVTSTNTRVNSPVNPPVNPPMRPIVDPPAPPVKPVTPVTPVIKPVVLPVIGGSCSGRVLSGVCTPSSGTSNGTVRSVGSPLILSRS